jgi:cold-inducible RNA-binding protein
MKLFVAGFPADFDETDLKEMFELYGEVASAKLIVDRATGKSKGFAFIDMPDDAEAKQTIETLDGANLSRGKSLSVKEAENPPRGGSGGGGGNYGNRGGGGSYGGGGNRGGSSGGGGGSYGGNRDRGSRDDRFNR